MVSREDIGRIAGILEESLKGAGVNHSYNEELMIVMWSCDGFSGKVHILPEERGIKVRQWNPASGIQIGKFVAIDNLETALRAYDAMRSKLKEIGRLYSTEQYSTTYIINQQITA